MEQPVNISEFLSTLPARVLLDVRSPGEYKQGHIPNAVSFPLFSDEERAKVGTCYKQQGPEPALRMGLKFVGPKMDGFVEQADKLSGNRQIAVHCWRGGKRSQSMAWLLRTAGFDVITLEGGYKMYRQHVLNYFAQQPFQICVIGGRTGTGKTKILRELPALGAQIIDLEGIAHHKGSAFGAIGEAPQPTVEQFENNLYEALQKLDPNKPVWVENESRSIGRVFIPEGFWQQMKVAPLFNVEIPQEARIQVLMTDYVRTDKSDLQDAFIKISQKLGGQHFKAAFEALDRGDYAAAAEIALRYYDKTYQYALDQKLATDIKFLTFEHGDPAIIARALLALN
ncbi:MAG: tRNA 2-selenouridine(34) synthase MnmH [Bacteroidota bacterium]